MSRWVAGGLFTGTIVPHCVSVGRGEKEVGMYISLLVAMERGEEM